MRFCLVPALVLAWGACGDAIDRAPIGGPTIELDSTRQALPLVSINLMATVSDPQGGEVEVSWQAEHGHIEGTGSAIAYTAPDGIDQDAVVVTAEDSRGGRSQATVAIAIGEPTRFRAPIAIAPTAGNSKMPSIAALDDDSIHVVWHDFVGSVPALSHAVYRSGSWSYDRLALATEYSAFADLVTDGGALHLLWHVDVDGQRHYAVRHAIYTDGAFRDPSPVGTGAQVSAAMDSSGRLHALAFHDGLPVHYIYDGGAWRDGDPIAVAQPFVNALRMKALAHASTIELLISTSPGGTGYDVHLFSWSDAGGWSDRGPLYTSTGFLSDDVGGALDRNGEPHWVWTEQNQTEFSTMDVVESHGTDPPRVVSHGRESNLWPSMAFPRDNQPIVAWSDQQLVIQISRFPYPVDVAIGGVAANAPTLTTDSDGFTHLVYYGKDDAGVQQVFYTTNRP